MSTKKAAIQNAEAVIERFGGIRPMASKINVPVTTVQGWKKRNVIPGTRREEIEAAASDLNIDLSDLMAAKAPVTDSVANENTQAKEPEAPQSAETEEKSVFEKVEQQSQNTKKKTSGISSDLGERKEEKARSVSKQKAPAASAAGSNSDLLKQIEADNKKTVVTTTWIVTGLILLAAALMTFFFWPSSDEMSQKLEEQEKALSALQSDVDQVNEKTSFLSAVVPDDIEKSVADLKAKAEADLEALQNQARNTQIAFEQLKEKTDAISEGVLGENAGPLSKRLSVLEAQLAEMTGGSENNFSGLINRIQKLEESVPGQNQMQSSITELKDIVGGLDGKVTTLEDELGQAQTDETALGQTLEGVSGNDLKAAAMLIAFSQLRDSLNRQAPFEEDLVLLNKMVGDDNTELTASLEKLAPHAQGGVLTKKGLSSEFRGLAGDIVVSSLKGEDISIKDKAVARLNDVIQVEKDGELVTGTDTQATVAKAQAMLDNGDVEGAIAQLQTLDGEAAQTAQPFIDQAQASLLSDQVQQMLRNTILSKVGGQFGGIVDQLPTQMIPQQQTNVAPEANGQPAQTGFDMNAIKKTLEEATTPREVIKDEESGLSILPRQQGFKGFSAGQ
ncbi:MAG: hypothetical protein HRT94_04295 [Alphaproteobacteria bacterium]|nr:hypothetical protein [Alphaproteobacteria bacterium]